MVSRSRRSFLGLLLAVPGGVIAGRVAGKSEDRLQVKRLLDGDLRVPATGSRAGYPSVDLAASNIPDNHVNTWTSSTAWTVQFDVVYVVPS